VVEYKPSPNYTCDYVVTMDHNGKMMVKYVGAYTEGYKEECVSSKRLCI
jgi:hypothetical protein